MVQNDPFSYTPSTTPIRVGIVGTGYAAQTRAETLKSDWRSQLVALTGHTSDKTKALCQRLNVEACESWEDLVERDDLDLVVISSINRDHGTIVRAALKHGKHVIVEYPLSLDPNEAEELIELAQQQQKMLHVEHIELLGGLHTAIKKAIADIGQVFYARYITISPKHPAPEKWTYQQSLFGFPFSGALSRLHRLTDLFGQVKTVNGQSRFWSEQADQQQNHYKACLCTAQLEFQNGILAEAVYGKGEVFWESENTFTLYGENGTLIFTPQQGQLIQGESSQTIEVGSRRGLFAKDTQIVLEHLLHQTPLYVTASESAYTLKVADAVKQSAQTGKIVVLEDSN
ncbi:Gfo/Idh/MocA family protein [Capilliphycus salinus ALCB114379]|uniref:Gfo/Idh/MocA family protein n=1 Tax=Capilliphycus salinus TaxID=2768948 RepID=UPI0039A51097